MATTMENMRGNEDDHISGQKRTFDDMEETEDSTHAGGEEDAEMTGLSFQQLLKRKDIDLLRVLKRYLHHFEEAKPDDEGAGVDVVLQYLEASPNCEELMDILKATNRTDGMTNATLGVLTAILIRLAQDPKQHRATALRLTRQLIRSHFEALMRFLNVSRHGPRAVLRMFAVVVTMGHQCAQELLGSFNIGAPHLQKLGQIRKGKEDDNPRTHFVKFAVSLFISDSSEVIEKTIKCKEFCHTLFHDLILDKASLVQLILTALRDRVVQSNHIPRNTKRLLFSAATLGQISELYTWSEMYKGSKDPGIIELAHNFLQLVCCSPKYGICNRDDTYGLDGRVANTTLLMFVSKLKTLSTLKHPLMGDLVVSIFKTCPDILAPYLRERGTKFTPRPYPDWLNNINLFEKIYTVYPDISPILLEKRRTMSLEWIFSVVMVTALPPIFTREQYLNNFKGLSLPVHFGLLKVCKLQLQRAVKIVAYCEDQAKKEQSMLSPKEWDQLVVLFKKACKEVLPDAEFFIGFYQKQQTYLRSESKKQKPEEEDSEEWMKSQTSATTTDVAIKPEIVLLGILDILRLQLTLFPDSLESISSDLNGIFSESLSVGFIKKLTDDGDLSIRIVKALMGFLRGVPAKKILWFKSKKTGSLFSQALTLLLSSELVQAEAELLLCKILLETGHFETEDEATAWLLTLHDLDPSHRVAVIDFLKKSLVKVVRNPHPFNDLILDAMASAQLTREGDDRSETASTAEAGIAAILDQEAYDIEPASQEDIGITPTNVDHSAYCSALLPAALEEFFALKVKSQADGIDRYISSVISLVIHQQKDPVPVCLLVENCYKKAMEVHKGALSPGGFTDCLTYCQFWQNRGRDEKTGQGSVDEGAISHLVDELESRSFIELLQSAFLLGGQVFSRMVVIGRLNGLAQILPSYMILPACRQIMFYLQSGGQNRSIFDGVLVNLLHIIWERANQLQEESATTVFSIEAQKTNQQSNVIPWEKMAHVLFTNEAFPDWQKYGSRLSFPQNMEVAIGADSCLQKHLLVLLEKFVNGHLDAGLSQKLSDSIFTNIVAGCMHQLANLEGTSAESKWKKYYKRCDWREHVGLANQKVFQELCCQLLNLLPSFPGVESLLQLFLALPSNLVEFPHSAIDSLVSIVDQKADPTLDEVFCNFAEQSPAVALKVSVGLLDRCLKADENKGVYSRLVQTLIVHSPVQRIHFAELCCTQEGRELVERKLTQEPSTFQPLICKYLTMVSQQSEKRKKDVEAHALLLDVSWAHLLKAYQEPTKRHPNELRLLLEAVCRQIPTAELQLQAGECAKHIVKRLSGRMYNFLQTIFGEMSSRDDCVNMHETSLAVLKEVLDSCNKCTESRRKHYRTMIAVITTVSQSIPPDERLARLWKKFTSSCIKDDFQSPHFQEILKRLTVSLYGGAPKSSEGLLLLKDLLTRVAGHPTFVPTMMEQDGEKSPDVVKARAHLAEMMLFIAKTDASCLSVDHVVTWLGAYQATGNPTDRILLQLLEVYEANGVDMKAFRPFLWGQAAMDHYSTAQALSPTVLARPTMREVLDLIDPYRMLQTALKMALDKPLSTEDVTVDPEMCSLYDPNFMLPLFSSLLEPECLVDCLKFVECNGLFLAVASLSSYYEDTRRMASYILTQYEQHLEGARFRGRREISHLLACLKNTIPSAGARLPSITTIFVGRAFSQMLNPSGPVFEHIMQYVSIEPKLPLNLVPAFNSLFLAKGEEHDVKRTWILNLLEDGLRDYSDFVIYVRNNIWSLLMTLAGSPHCSKEHQVKIMNIITKAVSIPPAALSLISNHSLLTWTLSCPTRDEGGMTRTLGVFEGVIRSIGDLWKKDPTIEISRVAAKTSRGVYVNCLALLKASSSPGPTVLLKVFLLLQTALQSFEEVSKKLKTSSREVGQILSTTSLRNVILVYAKTVSDPGLPDLGIGAATGVEQKTKPDSDEQQNWIADELNQRTADALYYIVYYWLKHRTGQRSIDQEMEDMQVDNTEVVGQCHDELLPVVIILWSLNHFVRRKGEVATQKMSELLSTISAVCATNREMSGKLACRLQEREVADSVLSVYHLLNVTPSNGCLDNTEREAITGQLSLLLLDLSIHVKVKRSFRGHMKEQCRTASDRDTPAEQEELSVLLRELWGGESRPQCCEKLLFG